MYLKKRFKRLYATRSNYKAKCVNKITEQLFNHFTTSLLLTSYISVPLLHGKYYYTNDITCQNNLGHKAWHHTDIRRNHSSLKDILHIFIVSFKSYMKVLLSLSISKNSTLLNVISLNAPESILNQICV